MNPSESAAFVVSERVDFGDFRLDRVQRRAWHKDGTRLALSARLFDALLFFVEHAGQLLDKDQLMAALWPGQVVEENNLNQMVLGLRRALGDDGGENRYILTVPRRGFRFVVDVRQVRPADPATGGDAVVHVVSPADSPNDTRPPLPSAAPATGAAGSPTPARRGAIVAGAAFAAAAAGAMAWRAFVKPQAPAPASSTTTAVAVLPFKTLIDAGRDEVLELGMADSVIARLSAARGLVIRPVGSVRRYAAKDTDPLRAARELEVAWVLDGTVQRSGDRVRVTARLLDASSGAAAWSGSFDEQFTNVFDVQDAISQRVAAVLVPQLSQRERTGLSTAGTRNAQASSTPPHATNRNSSGQTRTAAAWRFTSRRSRPIRTTPTPVSPSCTGACSSHRTWSRATRWSRRARRLRGPSSSTPISPTRKRTSPG
jgi:TolB-like protein/DNA-binding winged helix-turn-helix (wHTH) protein